MPVKQADSDHELVSQLLALSTKNKKLIRTSVYEAPADPTKSIRSWRLNEHQYYKVPSPFPTLARGLFTTWESENPKSEEGDKDGKHRIVVRGYDKFFNIGEVSWCTWEALEKHTSPPYVMTLKSNGCIIFIAALSQAKILVTSKHSLGPVEGSPASHAQMGEIWLRKQLEAKGKTVEQLAQILWDKNLTAVAELCDDSFEEHVLPYSPEKTGLHLHGINESTGAFKTTTSSEVAEFAREWGFIETPFHTVNSISEVKEFSDRIAKEGNWNGEPIEGFVVRCHVSATSLVLKDSPPYPPVSSFFFKVKYDEPYMTYRDWREITKMLLSAKGKIDGISIPKSKLRRQESHLYLQWVRAQIKKDRKAFDGFTQGKGIIATRNRFLQWLSTEHESVAKGLATLKAEETSKTLEKDFGKAIIVPVAIPGCGKTSVAVALSHLFDFGHVQSDDISAKKPAPIFLQRVVDGLKEHDVVIADKNNHLIQHRQQLRDAVKHIHPPVCLLALYWRTADELPATVHRICSDRVLRRGENHQTLRPDKDMRHHEDAIWMFIKNSEELLENEVDEIIEMDLEESLERNLDRAIDGCVRILGLPKPSLEEVGMALAKARGYRVQQIVNKQNKRASKIRYYALLPEIDLREVIEEHFNQNDIHPDMKELWETMSKSKRITVMPHVTLSHLKELPAQEQLWNQCASVYDTPDAPLFLFRLGNLISNGRVMAATVEDLKPAINPRDSSKGARIATAFVQRINKDVKDRLHVTVGTREQNIAPVEALAMVESWRNSKAGKEVHVLPLKDDFVKGKLKGMTN